ncbi:MAG: hypothetical protein JJ896_04215 [Rhodothermales bacterium]|nr:hypothetical protein [Rhodothermales bacterium]
MSNPEGDPARSAAALRLIADLLEHGLHGSAASQTQARALFAQPQTSGDEQAASHQALMGMAVPPIAGLFLDPDGQAGREAAERVLAAVPGLGDSEHLWQQLRALAGMRLAGATKVFERLRADMILAWVPSWSHAAGREGYPEYAELAEVALSVCGKADTEPLWRPNALPLPTEADSLLTVCRLLTSHASTGVFVGRNTVRRIGRAVGVPCGFAGRVHMLQNLLLGASQYGALDGVADALLVEADYHAACWTRRPGPWEELWTARREVFRSVVNRLRDLDYSS